MARIYIEILPKELRDILDVYLLFDSINIIIDEYFFNKINDNRRIVEFLIIISCCKKKPFKFAFNVKIDRIKEFIINQHSLMGDRFTPITIERDHVTNYQTIDFNINSPNQSFTTIHTLTKDESYMLLLKFQSLVNDISNKRLRRIY